MISFVLATALQITMRLAIALLPFVALASAQFGGFGGNFGGNIGGNLGNAANRLQQRVSNIASRLPSPPVLSNVQDFGDFLVSTHCYREIVARIQSCHMSLGAIGQILSLCGGPATARGHLQCSQDPGGGQERSLQERRLHLRAGRECLCGSNERRVPQTAYGPEEVIIRRVSEPKSIY